MISSVISSLQMVEWREVIKLYFLPDSVVPILISGIIAFYYMF